MKHQAAQPQLDQHGYVVPASFFVCSIQLKDSKSDLEGVIASLTACQKHVPGAKKQNAPR